MKLVRAVKISEDVPTIPYKYVLDVRVIDPAQGTTKSPFGFTVFEYDKSFTACGNNLGRLALKVGNRLTEEMCSD